MAPDGPFENRSAGPVADALNRLLDGCRSFGVPVVFSNYVLRADLADAGLLRELSSVAAGHWSEESPWIGGRSPTRRGRHRSAGVAPQAERLLRHESRVGARGARRSHAPPRRAEREQRDQRYGPGRVRARPASVGRARLCRSRRLGARGRARDLLLGARSLDGRGRQQRGGARAARGGQRRRGRPAATLGRQPRPRGRSTIRTRVGYMVAVRITPPIVVGAPLVGVATRLQHGRVPIVGRVVVANVCVAIPPVRRASRERDADPVVVDGRLVDWLPPLICAEPNAHRPAPLEASGLDRELEAGDGDGVVGVVAQELERPRQGGRRRPPTEASARSRPRPPRW